jgi:hypothetical protein
LHVGSGSQHGCNLLDERLGDDSDSEGGLGVVKALYDQGWIVPFDWPGWHEEAERLFKAPKGLADADAATIRRLLTLPVRKDRFCEGNPAGTLENGQVPALPRRPCEIHDGAPH